MYQPTEFDKKLLEVLKNNQIHVVVLAGFLSILGEEVIKAYPNRILNVHPSLIPSFCGAGFYGLKVHQAALEKGVKVTGATVHFVNEICDGGAIIAQKAVDVLEGDTPETLQKACNGTGRMGIASRCPCKGLQGTGCINQKGSCL